MKELWAERIGIGLSVLAGFGLTWILASWIDVIAHNSTTCAYAWWNFFTICF